MKLISYLELSCRSELGCHSEFDCHSERSEESTRIIVDPSLRSG